MPMGRKGCCESKILQKEAARYKSGHVSQPSKHSGAVTTSASLEEDDSLLGTGMLYFMHCQQS